MKLIPAALMSLALFAMPALAQEQATPVPAAMEESMMSMLNMRPGMEMSEADRGYMKAMQDMQQDMMKMQMTGDPSGDFARMMIPHHQSAIAMVDVVLAQKDVDPEMRKKAEKMKTEQAKEVGELKAWLEKHEK